MSFLYYFDYRCVSSFMPCTKLKVPLRTAPVMHISLYQYI